MYTDVTFVNWEYLYGRHTKSRELSYGQENTLTELVMLELR